MKNNAIILIVISILSAVVAGYWIWSNANRYYLSSVGSSTYKIDRKTGETTLLRGDDYVFVEPSEEPVEVEKGSNAKY